MEITLDELSAGQSGRITRLEGEPELRMRLMDMGLVRGTEVRVVRVAPLGDPVEFELRGYRLTLRGEDARCVWIDVGERL
ncbi:MAG TPA: ferrous iron transport protein A [Methermicoccus shengliensis]|uniref:Ferrous iron transport protein A n=2 Tax=Methermicoccus shengliensis TaxID=660064 RepID=A0A832RVR9_9EURY|nr:ferrous iron transport protein A [Methermicoccus shengliensis]